MEWYHILVLIFALMVFAHIIGCPIYAYFHDNWNVFVPMPKDFKYMTSMNWFGCIVCYIFLFLLFPVFNICKFIYWLFHV